MDEAVRFAHKYEQQGYDLIISRGITCKMIHKVVSIPVVMIDTTYFDLLSALHEASQYPGDMEYFHYRGDEPRSADLNAMLQMLGIDRGRLHLHAFTTGQEVEQILSEKLVPDAIVIGTGLFVLNRASKLGFHTVMIASRQEAFLNAFSESKQLLEVSRKSGFLSQQLQALASLDHSGLILLDDRKYVEYVSDQALSLLHMNHEEVLGRPFRNAYEKSPLSHIFQQKSCQIPIGSGYLQAELHRLFRSSESIGYAISLDYSTEGKKGTAVELDPRSKGTDLSAKYTLSDMLGKSSAIEQLKKRLPCMALRI